MSDDVTYEVIEDDIVLRSVTAEFAVMKVNISFTLDVDPDAWALEYGIEKGDVREDVKVYVENGVHDDLRDKGLLL